jgi:uncharacterized protein YqgC (DUF456 family)
MTNIIGLVIACIFFLLGILGTILPALPGAPLIWLGMLIYGFLTQFQGITTQFYIWQGIAVALTFLIDYVGTAYGTRRYGGSSAAIWGGIIGLIVAPFIFGLPIGLLVGPFLGSFLGEILRGKAWEEAFRVAFGTLVGLMGGTLLKFIIEAAMIVWFFWTILA